MIYQGCFTIKGNSLLFGNVVATFFGGVGGGSKIFRSHFQYNSACETFVISTFFLPGSESCPLFGNASIFPFIKSFRVTPTLSVNSSLWSCSLRLGFGMELCLGPFQTVSYVLEYIQEYWGKVHKSIDLFYSPLICNGIFTFSILKTLLFGTGKKVKSNESWGVVFLRMAKECSHRIGRRDTEQIRYLLWATISSL